ncbi:MAG: mono/diheme cytochrome c family protein [Saprospiraceae bacterium]|jgi:mono/diheme cytochrome c family protein
MNFKKYTNWAFILTAGYILSSCAAGVDNTGVEYAPQMYHSIPYEGLSQVKDKEAGRWLTSMDDVDAEFYTSNPNNPYEMNMREPVANTVRRNKNGYLPYRIPKDSLELAAAVKNPLPEIPEITAEGKVLFSRYCLHCHGEQGMGDGPVGKIFLGVTAYNSRAVADKSEGHIFHVITHGKGRMGAHGSQVSVEDRWKIVRYVQTLQKQ